LFCRDPSERANTRAALAEQRPCPLGDGDHRRVAHRPLDGDGIEALPDRVEAPYEADVVVPSHLGLDRRRHGEQSRPGSPKGVDERAVFERADDTRPEVLSSEPILE
jgi:hypothetical protein